MNRQAQAVILMLFGGAILRISLSDVYLRYVKEGLRPFLIVAGAVLVAAAAMTLWFERRSRADSGDGHGHHEPRVGWLLLLPVLGLLLVAPPALGAYAANQQSTALSAPVPGSNYPQLPPGDPVKLGLLEYAARAVFDEGKGLPGRKLQLSGFISYGPQGEPRLTRIVMSCCAADGRPIKIGMTGKAPADLPPDTWVQITGAYSDRVDKDTGNWSKVPYLDVASWQRIPAPRRPYE